MPSFLHHFFNHGDQSSESRHEINDLHSCNDGPMISGLMQEVNSSKSAITMDHSGGVPINKPRRKVSFSPVDDDFVYIPSNNMLKQVEKARSCSDRSSLPDDLRDCSLTSIFLHGGSLLSLSKSP
ncbi:hypothetical protein AYI68_g6253 [Smittium mucronatum]|uniref:Uncharacterized protein n=1 Tax=Smittium mucronatum TaxID=133383 RepID=A0A1R0GQ50_9FUNG|nr:hypothetical protein AYI68_g6936 [Smittium mucronatum]OLY79672.1 hypothetical protein AYI68_g6253 [Smittium mucronatum]